jgi:VIT1/CCC1 family predicted Fe2+/Mn2+ transporter
MSEDKKDHGFIGIIKDGLEYTAHRILANISPPITEGVEKIVQNLEDRIIRIEERMIRKIISFAVIGLGAIFLVFALFFFLREFLGWSNSAAFFSIGIVMFVAGLLLKVGESER